MSNRIDPLFLQMYEAGLVNHSSDRCLVLSDTEWWPPEEIEAYEPPDYHIPGLVPFAMTGTGDHWSWYGEWKTERGAAVVFSPHAENTATGYAPDLVGSIYRLLLEEMSGSCLVQYGRCREAEVGSRFVLNAEYAAPFLPEPWAETVRNLAQREVRLTGDGVYQVLTLPEARAIIQRDLAFDGLDVGFKQYV